MSVASAISAKSTNVPLAKVGIVSAESGTNTFYQRNIRVAVAKLFGTKPWAALMDALGLSERAAKHRMAGTRAFTLDEAFELLRRPDGYKILSHMMTALPDPKPEWWQIIEPLMEIVDAQRLQLAAQRQIETTLKRTLDADRNLSATLARGHAALLHHDPRFYSAHLDPMGQLAGHMEAGASVPNSPLVKAGRRRRG